MKNAILLHLHYQDLWPEFWSYLKDIKDENTHIYVTVHTTETEWYNDIKSNVNEVFVIENKGMDFGGFLYAYNKIKHIDYLTITKLHGKKRRPYESLTLGLLTAEEWKKNLYLPLIEKKSYSEMLNLFKTDENTFMYGSKDCFRKDSKYQYWVSQNDTFIVKTRDLLNLSELQEYEFIAGSMFAACKSYLDKFFKNKEMEIFNVMKGPPYPINGSIAHSLERLIGAHVSDFGGKMHLR